MKSIYTIILVAVLSIKGQAQEFSSFYSYLLNRVNVNSAYTGNNEDIQGVLNSRSQFTGVPGSPRNIMLAIHGPMFINQGVGLKVINDTRGVFDVTRVDGSYSHQFDMNEHTSLRLGMSVGFLSSKVNLSGLDNADEIMASGDPTLTSSGLNYTHFVSGFGMLFKHDGFELGFAAPHIIENGSEISQFLVSSFAYKYQIENSKWSLSPNIIYQNIPVTNNVLDGYLKTTWDNKVSVIVGVANNNRLKAGAGFDLKGFGLNYIYEQSTGDLKNLSNATHEIMMTISIQRKVKRLGSAQMEEDLDNLISKISEMADGDYEKEFLREQIKVVHAELNKILEENTEKNVEKVAGKLDKIEEKINYLIKKYELDK